MYKPTTMPDDIRQLKPKKEKTYITAGAVKAAKKYPNQHILLSKGDFVDKCYAPTLAWQAENIDPELRVYWSFQKDGTTENGSYIYKGSVFLSYGEVEDSKEPVKAVAPKPTKNQLVSVLTWEERARLIEKVRGGDDELEEGKEPTPTQLLGFLSAAEQSKLAKRYWEKRGMSAGVARTPQKAPGKKMKKQKATQAHT